MPDHSKDYKYKPLLVTKEKGKVWWCSECGNYLEERTATTKIKSVCQNIRYDVQNEPIIECRARDKWKLERAGNLNAGQPAGESKDIHGSSGVLVDNQH